MVRVMVGGGHLIVSLGSGGGYLYSCCHMKDGKIDKEEKEDTFYLY